MMPADTYFFVSIFFKLNIHTYYEDDIVSQADYNYSSSLLWFQVNIIVSTDMCSFLLGHRITNADCPFHIHACAAECAHEHALNWLNLLWSAGLEQGTQLQIRVNQLRVYFYTQSLLKVLPGVGLKSLVTYLGSWRGCDLQMQKAFKLMPCFTLSVVFNKLHAQTNVLSHSHFSLFHVKAWFQAC